MERLRKSGYDLFESRHRAKDGREYDVEVSCSAWRATGDVHSFFRDITARKQAEAEIRRLNAELEARVASRTEQLEVANRELEALAYSISHDVRAPLRVIDGFSAMVLEDEAGKLDCLGRPSTSRACASRRSASAASSTTCSGCHGSRAPRCVARPSTSARSPPASPPSCARSTLVGTYG